MEMHQPRDPEDNLQFEKIVDPREKMSKALKRCLLLLNLALMVLGESGGPLLMRLYFNRGGNRIWLSSWLETGGWPIFLFPLLFSYLHRRSKLGEQGARLFFMKPRLFVASASLGLLTGLVDYLYAYGMSRLPVSTISLINSSQLAFNALFSFLLVRQRFTPFSINSVVLLTIGAIVLGLHSSSDRPKDEAKDQYYMGFFVSIGAAVLYGLLLPMVEFTYKRAKQAITYPLVMEIQMVMSIFATAFCTVGMLVNKDFKAIGSEAREHELGVVKYYVVLVCSAIFWQFFYLGAVGVIFYASSLVAGITSATLLPILEILAVIFYKEKFKGEKGISLTLALWGFTSYFYGELKGNNQQDQKPESEPHQCPNSSSQV
ncbi:PREDICTED: purine permease 3-like [Nelumbo nucifera]|uniref:Probable purine permease n=2 Tax=Nelumbo nucifera TaxID=4432 RepID=A0A1U8AG52_NELNU|nr:PREDICTED: purine permease 3-like [Nelumbo nucifera]DAD40999.1 TPA_asm: hypothetical protein HUJ06_015322 [Nelumbo nucifera]